MKQLDRLLSNVGVKLEELFPSWIRFVVGVRTELIVALDWTEFGADDHVTLCAYAVTRHGRATPLIWKTHRKSDLEGHRTQWEHELVQQLHLLTLLGGLSPMCTAVPPLAVAVPARFGDRRAHRGRRSWTRSFPKVTWMLQKSSGKKGFFGSAARRTSS